MKMYVAEVDCHEKQIKLKVLVKCTCIMGSAYITPDDNKQNIFKKLKITVITRSY